VLVLLLDVAWPRGRIVRVSLRTVPLVRSSRVDPLERDRPTRAINPEDVASLGALHAFLAAVTRSATPGATVDVVGFEPDVDALLDLLEIEGPVPEVISVPLPER
jgi:hypothetical protein